MTARMYRLIWPRSLAFENAIKSAAELRRMARFLPWPINANWMRRARGAVLACMAMRINAVRDQSCSMLDAQWALRDRYQDERVKRWEEKTRSRSTSG